MDPDFEGESTAGWAVTGAGSLMFQFEDRHIAV